LQHNDEEKADPNQILMFLSKIAIIRMVEHFFDSLNLKSRLAGIKRALKDVNCCVGASGLFIRYVTHIFEIS
jgi:hypothetical protein